MKKILSIVLSVLMLISVFPVAVFAGDTATVNSTTTPGNSGVHENTELDNTKAAEGYFVRIGDGVNEATTTYYKTMTEAFNALPTATKIDAADPWKSTITLIADYTGKGVADGSEHVKNKAAIIDGNGYTWSNTGSYPFIWNNADITVKDLTYKPSDLTDGTKTRGFQFKDDGTAGDITVVVENVTMHAENIGVDLRGGVATNNHSLTIKNSELIILAEATGQNSNAIYGNHGTKSNWTIDVIDSFLSNRGKNGTNENSVIGLNNASNMTLNLKGNTVIEAAAGHALKGNYGIFFNASEKAVLNIDETVRFEANLLEGVDTETNYIAFFKDTKAYEINDAGATYAGNANAAKCGVVLPAHTVKSGETSSTGWSADGTTFGMVDLGATYRGETAFAFMPAFEGAERFYGNNGVHSSVLATDAAKVAEGYFFRIGENYYKTIAEAYDALPAGLDTSVEDKAAITVTMIANYTGAGKDPGSKAMIFDGNGYTWTLTTDFLFRWDNADLTIKNLSLTYATTENCKNRSVQFRPNAGTNQQDVVIENCTFETENINIDLRGGDAVHTYTHTLLVKNSYIVATKDAIGQNSNAIYGNHGMTAYWNITVEDSKLSNQSNNAVNDNCVIGLHNKANMTVNLKGATIIEAATNCATMSNYGIFMSQSTKATLNIDAGVKFAANVPDGVAVESNYVYFYTSVAEAVVNDKGSVYTANANAAKNGVILPAHSVAKEDLVSTGWSPDGTEEGIVPLGGTYKGDDAISFVAAFAAVEINDDNAVKYGYVAKTDVDGDGKGEYHTTVLAAVTALPEIVDLDKADDATKAKQTITLLKDIESDGEWGGMIASSKAIVLNGNGKKVTLTSAYAAFDITGSDLYVDDLDVTALRFVRAFARADLDIVVTDSNVTATYIMGFYLTGNADHETNAEGTNSLTLENSTVTANYQGDAGNNSSPIYCHYDTGANWEINVKDSDLVLASQVNSYSAVIAAHSKAKLAINLTGNTNLIIAGTSTGEFKTAGGAYHYGIYVNNNYAGENVKINVAPTVTFKAELPDDGTFTTVYVQLPASETADTLVNEGKFVANANAQKKGVILPAYFKGAEGTVLLGWSDGGEAVIGPDAAYANENATAAVTYAPVVFDPEGFAMNAGASIRLDGEMGIRFGATVSKKFVGYVGDSVTYGMLIAVADDAITAENFTKNDIDPTMVYVDITKVGVSENADGDTVVYGCLTGMPTSKASVNMKFIARAYCTVTFVNGATVTFYADYTPENARSISDVAAAAVKAGDPNKLYAQIVALGGAQ